MKVVRMLIAPLLALCLLLASRGSAHAQSAEIQFFPETGHSVEGLFLQFYRQAGDPTLVYGYPITEQFVSRDGKTVQYFQRARFELGANQAGNPEVQLTPLGQAAYKQENPLNLENPAGCQSFSTGFRVCYAFLDFYKANDGAAQFGNPISPFEFHDGIIVQYFERARFEWRANRPEGQRVVLSDLGRVYFDQMAEDLARLKPVTPQDATINAVLAIKVRAFVLRSVTQMSGQQTVYAIVQSQTLQPVSNANGKIVIHWPDGRNEEYFFTTNRAGVGTAAFTFSDQKQGELVPIDVIVTYQGLAGSTTTSFRLWY